MAHGADTKSKTASASPKSRGSSGRMAHPGNPEDLIEPTRRSSHSNRQPISEYSPSVSSGDRPRTHKSGSKPPKSRDGKPRWLSQVKEWFNTGEPSAQDFKQLRKHEFKKRGVNLDDPDAHVKMHAPLGQIPRTAIQTAGGPNPDKQAIRRAEQRKRASYNTQSTTAASISSASSSSTKLRSPIAPWEA